MAAGAAGCLGSAATAGRMADAGNEAAWIVHHDRRDGLRISTPPEWTFRLRPVPNLVEPTVPFAVGSWELPPGGDCAPTRAIHALPPHGVLLWLYEYHTAPRVRDFPARPAEFHLGRLGGPFECLGVRAYLIRFRDAGRYFQVHVVARRAGPGLRARTERVLSSLVVRPA